MGKKIKIEDVTLEWAKLTEDNRDMGPQDDSDTGVKISSTRGQYVVDVMITPEQEKEMKDSGIPSKGLQAQLFKQRDTGEKFYKAKRPHYNPKFDKRTPEQLEEAGEDFPEFLDGNGKRISDGFVGAPTVYKDEKDDQGKYIEWDFEEDGLIGNGTVATVKFDVWDGKITTLEAILITELVPYESNDDKGDF